MDFDSDEITDANDLRKLRQPINPTSRKLIGHSGPVYSLSFDPVPGASGPPRYLLSASQDATVRLWSLDTFSCLVAYRGHREPVWCVEWGPRGVYFATGSRDRTARLWSSDKTTALRIFAGHLSDVNVSSPVVCPSPRFNSSLLGSCTVPSIPSQLALPRHGIL